MAQLQILYKARGRKLEELTNDLHILKEDSSREIRWVSDYINHVVFADNATSVA